ncbi:MAG: hypothetical protein QNL77_04755 [Akkermansiaceae bacterium]
MKSFQIFSGIAALALMPLTGLQPLAAEQIGDLRLAPEAFAGGFSYHDPSFGPIPTQDIQDSPVLLTSQFTGTSQNPSAGGLGDPATDLGIRAFTAATVFRNVNRFASSADGITGFAQLGTIQYEVDLSNLEDHLTTTGESLSTLDLQLQITMGDVAKAYDIYLSYDSPSESIAQTSILNSDPGSNYANFWLPAQSDAVGNIVNGTHKIINLAQTGGIDERTSLLSAYNDGARRINIIIAVPSFYSGRTLAIESASGIYVETDALSEVQVGQLLLPRNAFPSYSYNDQFGPIETLPVTTSPFNIPSDLTAGSQNQGANPQPSLSAGIYSLDGENSGTTNFDGTTATITSFGGNNITSGSFDEFDFIAAQTSGDFSVDVKLADLTSLESGARAGLMVRSSLAPDSAHLFLGIQQTGVPVLVTRGANGSAATETLGTAGTVPRWLRITRSGDNFDFFLSDDGVTYDPVFTPATISLADPVYFGIAASSGSPSNEAVATFEELSTPFASSSTDIGIRTFSETTTIRALSRFASDNAAGVVQWAIDLAPLETYLTENSFGLDSLDLRLATSASDSSKAFDVYLSYDDSDGSIKLINTSLDSAAANYNIFFQPAIGAEVGDIINGTHRLLVANSSGDFNLNESVLSLYEAGVRNFNIIIASSDFYSGRTLGISSGSGIFIETNNSPGGREIVITDINRSNNVLTVTVDGLDEGATYHLGGSADLTTFPALPGTEIVAEGTQDTFNTIITDPAYFVRVIEGEEP